jgi:TonB-linked SusC/RagA family outer membrane protein
LLSALALALVVSAGSLVAQTGSISGQVTNAATGEGLRGVRVAVSGTNIAAFTNSEGRYIITAAPVGVRSVRAGLIGFTQQTRSVTVEAGSDVAADFVLGVSAIELSAVTISAVSGREKRAREIGSNVATIDVTAINQASVTSIADVLSARTEGVLLQDVNGTAGSAQKIRIRGANSLSLSNEPLVYVDGIRIDARNTLSEAIGGIESSRLNDINPNDIESIEIVKGPAAAALYGTAAANGVIQITTKRGRAGRPEWNFYVEYGVEEDITEYPINYLSYEVIGSGSAPFYDPATGGFNSTDYARCSNRSAAAGTCTQDGTTSFNTTEDPRTTPYSVGDRQRYGASVRGGTERVTYFLSGEMEKERGVIEYNTRDKINVRANMNARVTDKLDVSVSTSYANVAVDFNGNDNNIFSPIINSVLGEGYFIPESAKPEGALPGVHRGNYGFGWNQWDNANWVVNDDADRVTLGANVQYRPLSWLTLISSGGLDLTDGHTFETVQPGLLPIAESWENGYRSSDRANNYNYTFNASGISSFSPLQDIVSTTTVGWTFNQEKLQRTECYGSSLIQGTSSCGTTAALFSVDEDFSTVKTIGAYVSTEIAWRDRVFISGAFRGDDNSAFGTDFGFVTYPSAMGSWVIGEEDWFPQGSFLSTLRLRAAWGKSGLRPDFRDAVTLFDPSTVARDGSDQPGITVSTTGNITLEPEKITEFELGFDAAFLNDRVGIDFTYFDKRSKDALIERRLPPSYGVAASRFENLGEIKNAGTELAVTISAIQSQQFGLDLQGTLTTVNSEVVEIGEGVEPIIFNRGKQRHQEGREPGAYFQQPFTFDDADGNGLLENDEVSLVGDSATYIGPSLPTYLASVGANVRIFDWITFSTLFEFRGGNYQSNFTEAFRCGFRSTRGCSAVGNPDATLEDQARYIADRFFGAEHGYIEKADFGKWREMSVTLQAPRSVANSVPSLRGLTLTVAGRNLATWTGYGGLDPEANESGGSSNFTQGEFNTQPPVRLLMVRLNYNFR